MITFLFWNLHRKPLGERIARIAARNEIDIVILAECLIAPGELMWRLWRETGRLYYLPDSQCNKLAIYTAFPERFLQTESAFESERFTIRQLRLPGLDDVLLAAAHLPSKLHWSSNSLAFECGRLARRIREAEMAAGHSRTILVGDLNLNPFEEGVASAAGLHGVMTRRIARRGQRTIQGESYPFFYNPMWGRLGDDTTGPPGTFYNNRAEHFSFFWNTFDQVLVRPDLLAAFQNDDLRVLTEDGKQALISPGGLPDDNAASDHLPILFKLRL